MKFAFFQGCNIPVRVEQYADSTEAVLQTFGIELVRIPEFNCCGYPNASNVDEKAYIMPSVRNMAIAEKAGLDILVICNCCFASLQKAKSVVRQRPRPAGGIQHPAGQGGSGLLRHGQDQALPHRSP